MERCNSRPLTVPFFHHNLHLDQPSNHEEATTATTTTPTTEKEHQPLREVPPAFLISLIEKVERIRERLSVEEPLIERVLFHPGLDKNIKEAAERYDSVLFEPADQKKKKSKIISSFSTSLLFQENHQASVTRIITVGEHGASWVIES